MQLPVEYIQLTIFPLRINKEVMILNWNILPYYYY